mmetsp:Transcript_40000/g.96518  ORF Transcript_40000/g.96518 Transcript_40000/m.96518 type:complete len:102 (-) Transcript_40000:2433-2738(-)
MAVKPILATPYGRGVVVQTSYNADSRCEMKGIELIDWAKPTLKGSKKPAMLFSPISFPLVEPEIGDTVQSIFGHGKVLLFDFYHRRISYLFSLYLHCTLPF